MSRTRMKAEDRKAYIMGVALSLAGQQGYDRITREQIAERAGVKGPILHYYFGTMSEFRRELMRRAVLMGSLRIVAQGLAVDDPIAIEAPDDLKRRALASLMT